MREVTDAVGVALLAAMIGTALLAIPVSFVLILLYRRAVVRGMRRCASGSGSPSSEPASPFPASPAGAQSVLRLMNDADRAAIRSQGARLFGVAERCRSSMAFAHLIGGFAYVGLWLAGALFVRGHALTIAGIVNAGLVYAFPPLYAWSVVKVRRRADTLIWIAYFTLALLALSEVSEIRPARTDVGFYGLMILVLYPYLLLTHRLGAVGQVVASFIFVIAFGYFTALMVVIIALTPDAFRVGTPDALFAAGMALLGIAGFVGLDVETTKWLLMVVALALFVGPAIYAVRWLRRRYEAKRWSDQSLTIDSTYLLCALAHGGALAADADVSLVWSALPFLAYKVSLRASLGRVPRAATPPRLLLLRSFSLRGRGRRMFRNLEHFWRHIGPLQLISGPDLALSTVEPHEFLDFTMGKLERRFIDSQSRLAEALAATDDVPDADGRYRVTELFCHGDTWQSAVTRLAESADGVVMDLRGFSARNAGCSFEIGVLLAHMPPPSILLLVDGRTDVELLERTLVGVCENIPPAAQSRDARAQVTAYRCQFWTRSEDIMRLACEVSQRGRAARDPARAVV